MKVLIAYDSKAGHMEKMAQFMAEGARFAGANVEVKKISEIKEAETLKGYDAYIFGCPTYHRDMTNSMKTFLFLAEKAELAGKPGGAFGSYTHSGDAPKIIADTMEFVYKMNMDAGSFNLLEDKLTSKEGLKACQDFGKTVCEKVKK
jgi:flavorubredoxin